ncbi:hypothetical protein GECvBN5_gp156 [Salmonella phage GEC_vB_N5]|uniref:Uncharacterized protein n=1 Tax=Salmonella phage GEC_vB_N5 TaxID=2777378 RepID=A0A7S9XEE2_9CAUD|nr:hypothetical protein GECvBN5_gp156 [Salmonella phage GEC_vB_N5]
MDTLVNTASKLSGIKMIIYQVIYLMLVNPL